LPRPSPDGARARAAREGRAFTRARRAGKLASRGARMSAPVPHVGIQPVPLPQVAVPPAAPPPVLPPLVELHCHVDRAARPAALLELARQARVPLPADTVEGLLPHVRAGPASRTLQDFLATFETFYPVLRAPGAMGRLAHELVHDAKADGVIHLEARF